MNKKLGYYTIGQATFDSKIEACITATKILQNLTVQVDPFSLVTWHFNNEVFSSYKWTEEPKSSLDDLYYARAKYLREKYDYLIISYSGGADSHNLLMSFLNQKLHVDEVVVTHMHKAMKDYAVIDIDEKSSIYAYSSEYELQTIPRLKEISSMSPTTKIRVFDVSDAVLEAFSSKKDESWILHVREELNPVDASRYNYLQFPEFKKQLDFDKKIGIVLGVDKPRLQIDNNTGKVYTCFIDRIANISPIGQYAKDYTNTTIEYFYWSPDACDLLCKQAHTVLKWLKDKPFIQKFFHRHNPSLSRLVNERLLRPILYSTWNNNWFQADKGYQDWYSTFDMWFIEKHKNTLEYLLWKKGLLHVVKNCNPYLYDPRRPDGLRPFQSDYLIATL